LNVKDAPSALVDSLPLLFSKAYDLVAKFRVQLSLTDDLASLEDCLSSTSFQFEERKFNQMKTSVSCTEHDDELKTTSSDICYCKEDLVCPDAILARFFYEAVHAIRRIHAFKQKIDCHTPPRTRPSTEIRFKLEQDKFHSGYLLEHEYFGGIIVMLLGKYLAATSTPDQRLFLLPCISSQLVFMYSFQRLCCLCMPT
jgi:hypothetical protein